MPPSAPRFLIRRSLEPTVSFANEQNCRSYRQYFPFLHGNVALARTIARQKKRARNAEPSLEAPVG